MIDVLTYLLACVMLATIGVAIAVGEEPISQGVARVVGYSGAALAILSLIKPFLN